jgi:hypothetical protein
MGRLRGLWFVAVVVALLSFECKAQADQIYGSLPLSGLNITENGTNLETSTEVTAAFTFSSAGTGAYSAIPEFNVFVSSTISLTDPGTFTLSLDDLSNGTNYGTFTAASYSFPAVNTPDFYEVALLGTFTPGAGLLAYDPNFTATPTSVNISINQSGASLSEAITLSAPEPASLMLLGIGAVSLAMGSGLRRWRNAAKTKV